MTKHHAGFSRENCFGAGGEIPYRQQDAIARLPVLSEGEGPGVKRSSTGATFNEDGTRREQDSSNGSRTVSGFGRMTHRPGDRVSHLEAFVVFNEEAP